MRASYTRPAPGAARDAGAGRVGVGLGLVGGVLPTDLLTGVLYEVSPTDPRAYLAACPLLIVVVALASVIPALRAARLDPMVALRS